MVQDTAVVVALYYSYVAHCYSPYQFLPFSYFHNLPMNDVWLLLFAHHRVGKSLKRWNY